MKISQSKPVLILFLLFTLQVISCSKDATNTSGLYVPTSADTTANATLQELQQGRVLYIDHCAACHNLYSPDDFGSGQWVQILSTMGPRAGLSTASTTLVRKYLTRGN